MNNVGTALDRVDGVDKADLLKLPVSQANGYLPTVAALLVDHVIAVLQIQLDVVLEGLDGELLAIEDHFALLVRRSGDVIDPLHHEGTDVLIKAIHAELCEIWPEGHLGVVLPIVVRDLWLALCRHVVLKGLLKLFLHLLVGRLDHELCGEHIRQLGTETIAAPGHLLLIVVVVVAGEEVAKDELRHIDLVGLVDLDGQPLAIVPDLDALLLGVNFDLDCIHAFIALKVVCCIHKDLVENLVEGRNVADGF
mmetsp:Transcript_67047/g.190209  ORF Transcript_67047/g.190209 Transcript_67047/m.190209 type:complete len:251 (-) Transcript_67047:370-1122(-)